MKHQNSNSNADNESATRILAAAVLSVIFALTMTACSTATKPAETKPSETNKASASNPSPTSTSTGSSSTSGDLAGTYAVNGTGVNGNTYQGEVVVTRRDAVYQMSWKVGAENYDGIAVQSGNTMAAAYTTGTDGRGCGAIVYKINADNSLDGTWGEWGVNSVGTEKDVPIGDVSGGVGTFNATGTNATGNFSAILEPSCNHQSHSGKPSKKNNFYLS